MAKEMTVRDDKSVNEFISQAIEKGVGVETMERLFSLREKVKAEQAKEAFVQAMSDFQGECPVIEKKKDVKGYDGQVRYSYAPLDSIVSQVKKILQKNGLSYTVDAKVEGEVITAICKITHKLGHSETSSFSAPTQDTKNKAGQSVMSKPQQYAAALTFAKRYAFTNALGILTSDEDDDATSVVQQKDAKSSKTKIILRLKTLGEKNKTKEDVEEAVKRLTKLGLEEKNYEEIAERLQVLIDEQNADANSQI